MKSYVARPTMLDTLPWNYRVIKIILYSLNVNLLCLKTWNVKKKGLIWHKLCFWFRQKGWKVLKTVQVHEKLDFKRIIAFFYSFTFSAMGFKDKTFELDLIVFVPFSDRTLNFHERRENCLVFANLWSPPLRILRTSWKRRCLKFQFVVHSHLRLRTGDRPPSPRRTCLQKVEAFVLRPILLPKLNRCMMVWIQAWMKVSCPSFLWKAMLLSRGSTAASPMFL